jgi:hypothetical protein
MRQKARRKSALHQCIYIADFPAYASAPSSWFSLQASLDRRANDAPHITDFVFNSI